MNRVKSLIKFYVTNFSHFEEGCFNTQNTPLVAALVDDRFRGRAAIRWSDVITDLCVCAVSEAV